MSDWTQKREEETDEIGPCLEYHNEEWYFFIADIVAVLTESDNPSVYWRVLKKRLKDEGNETVTNCNALKMPAPAGKMRLTSVGNTKGISVKKN